MDRKSCCLDPEGLRSLEADHFMLIAVNNSPYYVDVSLVKRCEGFTRVRGEVHKLVETVPVGLCYRVFVDGDLPAGKSG